MIKSINIKALISGFFTFCVLTLLAFLLEMSLFYSLPFPLALGIHLVVIFARYSISSLIAFIEIRTHPYLNAMVLCIISLLFLSVIVGTIGPNQFKEKAAIIGVDLIIGLAACLMVAVYKGSRIKILPGVHKSVHTDVG
ncbi:MAG TPA: hypothetical protein VN328_10125 [Thermodesulfovibrionales bacterium]|nr:hypothetical protein [Thermodesulfovibrionales bacterium]